ncbi:hypothetical protein MIR68_011388 [Amoeboaphelidium protococcarum]|nr:hypothetical protein MIR68_011388 [Amoeboaphelidium protococcarum]
MIIDQKGEEQGEDLYCLCRQPAGDEFMIECDGCNEWYHGRCVDLAQKDAKRIEKYFCTSCQPVHGSITYKKEGARSHDRQRRRSKSQRSNSRRNSQNKDVDDDTDADQDSSGEMERNGSGDNILHVQRFLEYNYAPFEFKVLSGNQITAEYFRLNGFTEPILCRNTPDSLRMKMIPKGVTVTEIARIIGDRKLEVMNVKRQEGLPDWTLFRWAEYFQKKLSDQKNQMKLLNVISMEFSDTRLGSLVRRPKVVRQLDLVDAFWPQEKVNTEFPKVQLYCLMSPAGCWTDFHIDFGATSVYYHILSGQKSFVMIPPAEHNLRIYEQWCTSADQSSVYFADLVQDVHKITITAGDTMFIPAGWIHAVYTHQASIVIGGNFLHTLSMDMQFRIYELEDRCDTPPVYRFPYFETVHWYIALKLVESPEFTSCSDAELGGFSSLHQFLSDKYELALKYEESKSGKLNDKAEFALDSIPDEVKDYGVDELLEELNRIIVDEKSNRNRMTE